MEQNSYLVIDERVLPEVYQKVVLASSLLESGEAANTSEAVKLAGISRSVCIINIRMLFFPTSRRRIQEF